MNFVKTSLVEGTRGGVGASEGVRASKRVRVLTLPTSDLFAGPWGLASLSYSLVGSAGRLLQGLRQAQNPGTTPIKI